MNRKTYTFYVAPNGRDAWSGTAAVPGRTDGPFATIGRACRAVRSLKAKGKWNRPVAVCIRGGFYPLSAPLVFTPEDSGTREGTVVFRAYPGEKPVISGGRRITGWKRMKGDLWTAEIPEARKGKWYFRQLFVQGKRCCRPRLPREGFYQIAGLPVIKPDAPYETPCRQFAFKRGDLKSSWTNVKDIEVVVLHHWVDAHLPVAAIDEKKGIVTFSRASRTKLGETQPAWKGGRYYIENIFEALRPGEWYLNRKTGALYYWARKGEDPNRLEIVAPQLASLVRFEGEPERGRFVEHIALAGLTFSHNEWELPADDAGDYQAAFSVPGAIYGRGMRSCVIEQCCIRNISTYGLELAEGCHENKFVRSEISDAGGGGLKISGSDAAGTVSLRTGNNRITDNHLHHLGRIYPSAVGILARHTFGNDISHNYIHDLYYTGISVGWVWGYGESVSRDNRIEYNHIHHIGQGWISDMGGIYTLGVAPGTVIRNNLIHDITAYQYGGWAIYPDEGSSHMIIENNICFDTSHAVFHQHYGRENIVRNNIFAFGRQGVVAYSRAEDHQGFTFERNIVIAESEPFFCGGYEYRNLKIQKFRSDLNLFWDVSRKRPEFWRVFWETKRKTVPEADWKKIGHDRHSIIANPGFKDFRKRNFLLRKDSAAIKTGFERIDMSRVGPRRSLPKDENAVDKTGRRKL